MNKILRLFILILCLTVGIVGTTIRVDAGIPVQTTEVPRPPRIEPDYTDLVIPPNIAPMNFAILESGKSFKTIITGSDGQVIEKSGKNGQIRFSEREWKKLLKKNKGADIEYSVLVQQTDGSWQQFQTFTNHVAEDPIDTHLVYRLIDPMFTQSRVMGLFQRDLSCFKEKTIVHTRALNACYNCHSFCNKKPDLWMMHIRGGSPGGTYIFDHKSIKKIDTTTDLNKRAGAYRSWHPSGKMIAFSVNIVKQIFHSVGYTQEGYDKTSDLIVYNIEKNEVTTFPDIANPRFMETYPEWSPDGKYLYYCRAPQPDSTSSFEESLTKIMYDLMRVSYDMETNTWGHPEVVLSHERTGQSVTQPRISPDGKYISFALTKWGTFSIHRPGGDVYLMNLATGDYYPIEGNSDRPESYNTWSSNSRWLVYSSKKRDNVLARPYITYIDAEGKSHKSFILPQKDPTFYDTYLITYNVPELVNGWVEVSGQEIDHAALNPPTKAGLDPKIDPDAFTGATPQTGADADDYPFQ